MAAVVTCVGHSIGCAYPCLSSHHSPLSLHFWAGGACVCIWPIDQRKGVRPSPTSGTKRSHKIPGSPVKKAAVSYVPAYCRKNRPCICNCGMGHDPSNITVGAATALMISSNEAVSPSGRCSKGQIRDVYYQVS